MANVAVSSLGQQLKNKTNQSTKNNIKQDEEEEGTKNNIALEATKSSHLSEPKSSLMTATSFGNNNNNKVAAAPVVYDVEHLATFSTTTSHETNNGSTNNDDDNGDDDSNNAPGNITKPPIDSQFDVAATKSTTTPKVALQRLFELEKLSGIWTQRMQIELRGDFMLIVDCETNSTVERFNRDCVTKPEAFNQYNDIYNNIVVFVIEQQQPKAPTTTTTTSKTTVNSVSNSSERELVQSDIINANSFQDPSGESQAAPRSAELHIFQCVSHKAQQLVADIQVWKSQLPPKTTQNGVRETTKLHQQEGEDNKTKSCSSIKTTSASKSSGQEIKSLANLSPSSTSTSVSSTSAAASNHQHRHQSSQMSSKLNGSNGKPVITLASVGSASEPVPIVNVNVKETVQVFNQIAALREKSKPTSPTSNHQHQSSGNSHRPLPDASAVTNSHQTPAGVATGATNERDPLSPGGQIYRQRSIRATLAPKQATGNGAGSEIAPKSSLSSNSSSGSSSNANDGPKQQRGLASNKLGADQQQQAAKGTQINGNGRSSSHHHQQQHHNQTASQQQQRSHGKGSKSRSQQQQLRGIGGHSDSSHSHASSSSQSHLDQVTTNESYVSVLNHCFDDIEKFIIRLQQAVAASRELQSKRKLSKRAQSSGSNINLDIGIAGGKADSVYGSTKALAPNGCQQSQQQPLTAAELAMLSARARGPNEDDYFEILSKFKLAFNLLAKLKGCIHEPNAPELVHFLFTPLAIIIESARNATPPIDPTLVGIPYLNQDALDLLSNCCTSKESDMWLSLGPNWTQTIDINLLKASRLPSSFQPIFSDGWAPIIGELELIGLVGTQQCAAGFEPPIDQDVHHHHPNLARESMMGRRGQQTGPPHDESYLLPAKGGRPSSRDYKNKHGATSPPPPPPPMSGSGSNSHHHHHHPLDPYLNSATSFSGQYGAPGYLHEPEHLHSASAREHSRRSRSVALSSQAELAGGRRTGGKQQSSVLATKSKLHHAQHNFQEDHPNYDAMRYNQQVGLERTPDVDADSQLDMEFIAGQRMHSSDGYMELQDNHLPVDELQYRHHYHHQQFRLPKGVPGPSHPQNYRQASSKGHKSQTALYAAGPAALPPFENDQHHYLNEIDHEAMLVDLGPAQTEWFFELQARGAMIVRVLFTREANNDKELSVRRGEILEVLDDTRKWWRARNIDLQAAHVPHTIVAIMHGYQTLDELLANNPADMMANEDEEANLMNSAVAQQRYHRRSEVQPTNYLSQWHTHSEDKRNSKTAGAFRYF